MNHDPAEVILKKKAVAGVGGMCFVGAWLGSFRAAKSRGKPRERERGRVTMWSYPLRGCVCVAVFSLFIYLFIRWLTASDGACTAGGIK